MKKLLPLILSLLLLLCACQPAETTLSPRELFEMEVNAIKASYADTFTEEFLEEFFRVPIIDFSKTKYTEDPVHYTKMYRIELEVRSNYRAYGSLTAPVAPDSYEEACEAIREEFAEYITDENREVLNAFLIRMENEVLGSSDTSHYSESPQKHFDEARLKFWELYVCEFTKEEYQGLRYIEATE